MSGIGKGRKRTHKGVNLESLHKRRSRKDPEILIHPSCCVPFGKSLQYEIKLRSQLKGQLTSYYSGNITPWTGPSHYDRITELF